jgi:hypothetical protein
LYGPPDQSLAVQFGYTFTPAQLPPPEDDELLLDDELELLLEELELLDDELELLEDELELDDEELLEELEPPPNCTSIQLKKRSSVQ